MSVLSDWISKRGGVVGAAIRLLDAAVRAGESWAKVREALRTDARTAALRRDLDLLREAADGMRRALSIR